MELKMQLKALKSGDEGAAALAQPSAEESEAAGLLKAIELQGNKVFIPFSYLSIYPFLSLPSILSIFSFFFVSFPTPLLHTHIYIYTYMHTLSSITGVSIVTAPWRLKTLTMVLNTF